MTIREHYNKIRRSHTERKESDARAIRYVNNFIKACLIHEHVKQGMSVLDLGCGKGGDLHKYEKCQIKEYYGLDIAEVSIYEARLRHNNGDDTFRAYFDTVDVYNTTFDLRKRFDIISCQFSFHYAFHTDKSLSCAVQNIARHLKQNGLFIFTVPNKQEILRRVATGKVHNRLYKIVYNGDGNEYFFSLKGCIDNCVEYFVDMNKLRDKLHAYNIMIMQQVPFGIYYKDNLMTNSNLARRMRCRRLNDLEWEVVSLYDAVVCRQC